MQRSDQRSTWLRTDAPILVFWLVMLLNIAVVFMLIAALINHYSPEGIEAVATVAAVIAALGIAVWQHTSERLTRSRQLKDRVSILAYHLLGPLARLETAIKHKRVRLKTIGGNINGRNIYSVFLLEKEFDLDKLIPFMSGAEDLALRLILIDQALDTYNKALNDASKIDAPIPLSRFQLVAGTPLDEMYNVIVNINQQIKSIVRDRIPTGYQPDIKTVKLSFDSVSVD